MKDIVCPHCGKKVELSEAIIHQLSSRVREEENKKLRIEFEKKQRELQEKREKELREEFEIKNKTNEKELLELQKKLDTETKEKEEYRQKANEEAQKKADEEFRLKIKEKDKQLEDARRANEELNRKLNQKSQQLQGDILEIDLKENLKKTFQYDLIKDIPTGIRGGDIIQEVTNKFGNKAGIILWETKRQKAWNKAWLPKLRDDMRKIEASVCILVSDVLPQDIKVYDLIDNVWVTSYEYAIKLATVIRIGLLNVAVAKTSASHGDEELRKFYAIVTSDKFRHLFEKRQEIINLLKKELDADKASTERKWRRQGLYIDQLASNNRDLYGMLEDHIPSLKPLSEPEIQTLESGGLDENTETLF